MALQEFQRRRKFFSQRVILFIIIEEGHLLHPRIILFLQDSLTLSLIKKIIDAFQLIGKVVAIPTEEIKSLIRFQQSCSFLPGNQKGAALQIPRMLQHLQPGQKLQRRGWW